MRRWLVLGALWLGACIEGPAGPIGPGGKATLFEVDGNFDFEAVQVASNPLPTSTSTSALLVTLTGVLPPEDGRFVTLSLQFGLDTQFLAPPVALDVAQNDSAGTGQPLPVLDLFGDCAACPEPGGKRFEGTVTVSRATEAGLEAKIDLEATLSEPPETRFDINAFVDVARP